MPKKPEATHLCRYVGSADSLHAICRTPGLLARCYRRVGTYMIMINEVRRIANRTNTH